MGQGAFRLQRKIRWLSQRASQPKPALADPHLRLIDSSESKDDKKDRALSAKQRQCQVRKNLERRARLPLKNGPCFGFAH